MKLSHLAKRIDSLDNDYVMRLVHINYKAMLEKAKSDMRARAKAAAKEQDLFVGTVKKPFISDSELL